MKMKFKLTSGTFSMFVGRFGPPPAHFLTKCVVGLVWILMALYDMCVLMSATAPNSCKLAVYEGEVPRKSSTFFDFHTIWAGGEKKT